MKNIMIMLSTYNGEKYLREQLDSILAQEEVNIKIIVRDDGSTDNTLQILQEYQRENKLIYYAGQNIGYAKSFMELACNQVNQADYYAFCDQDDVWEPSKLINAIKKLEMYTDEKYRLYFSSLNIVDEHLNQIGFKQYNDMKINLGSAMVRYNISGCTMVLNNELLKIISKKCFFETNFSHDSWTYKVCLAVGGKVIYDNNSYIYYRQHTSNVTGVKQGVIKRLKKELNVFKNNKNRRLKEAIVIYNQYSSLLTEENKSLLLSIIKYRDSFQNYLSLLFNKDLKFGFFIFDLFKNLKIIFKVY